MSNKKFKLTYSALSTAERKEIEYIKSQYVEENEQTKKLKQLKQLDKKVKRPPIIVSITIGIIGILLFGLGFSLVLEFDMLILGIIFSVIGTIIMLIAYPIYSKLHKYLKSKYASKIISISESLLEKD